MVLKKKYFLNEDLKLLKDSCHSYKYEVTDKEKTSLVFYKLEEAVMALNTINSGELYGNNSTEGKFLMAKKINNYFPVFYTVGSVDNEEINHLKKTSDCLKYCTGKILSLQYRVGEEEKRFFNLAEAVEEYNNSPAATLWVEAGEVCVALATHAKIIPLQLYKDLNLKGFRNCYTQIEKAIDSLPKRVKMAIEMKYFNYISDNKIAERLSISYQTESKDIKNALLSLRVIINAMASPV